MTLPNEEFIRRFALHILPQGFVRIRHYGILSGTWKRERLPKLQRQLGVKLQSANPEKGTLLHRVSILERNHPDLPGNVRPCLESYSAKKQKAVRKLLCIL